MYVGRGIVHVFSHLQRDTEAPSIKYPKVGEFFQ